MRTSWFIVLGMLAGGLLSVRAQESVPPNGDAKPASIPLPVPDVSVDPNGDRQTTVILLQHVNATDLAPVAKTLLADDEVEIAVDARTNALIVRGNAATLTAKLLKLRALDVEGRIAKPAVISTRSTAAPSRNLAVASTPATLPPDWTDDAETRSRRASLTDEMAKLDEQVRAATKEIAKLQSKLGPDHPDFVAAKDALKKAVEAAFDARQKLQQTEVEHLRRRLQHLENSISLREKVKAEIVTSRVTELLDPSFQWNAPIRTIAPAIVPSSDPYLAPPAPIRTAPRATAPLAPTTANPNRTMSPAERAKAQARVELLSKRHEALNSMFQGGKMTLDLVIQAQRDLLLAELELATSSADRRTILEKVVDAQRRLIQTVTAKFDLGTVDAAQKYLVEAELLRTEQMLKAEEAGTGGLRYTSPIPQFNEIPQPSPSGPWKLLDFYDIDDSNASQAAREAQLKLAELDLAAAKQRVEAAAADVSFSERLKKQSPGSLSEQEFRRQQSAVDQAKTDLLRAETLLEYYHKALTASKLNEPKPIGKQPGKAASKEPRR